MKRDVVTLVETVYVQATAAPQIIVYVDQNGVPVSTQTQEVPAPATPTPAAVEYTNRKPEPVPDPSCDCRSSWILAVALADLKNSIR